MNPADYKNLTRYMGEFLDAFENSDGSLTPISEAAKLHPREMILTASVAIISNCIFKPWRLSAPDLSTPTE